MPDPGFPRLVKSADKGPEFDTGPAKVGGRLYSPPPPAVSRVKLRQRATGEVSSHAVVDAREILANPASLYERLEGEVYPASMGPTPTPPEAA